jgi:hypothetical protein
MKILHINYLIYLTLILVSMSIGCQKEVDSNCNGIPVYNGAIKNIIDLNCATAGCHDGNIGVPGNFLNYQGISAVTSNGKFKNRVLEKRDMPPIKELTNEEYQQLKCWAENGYPLQ